MGLIKHEHCERLNLPKTSQTALVHIRVTAVDAYLEGSGNRNIPGRQQLQTHIVYRANRACHLGRRDVEDGDTVAENEWPALFFNVKSVCCSIGKWGNVTHGRSLCAREDIGGYVACETAHERSHGRDQDFDGEDL